MARSRRRRSGGDGQDPVGLAGWLYTDLLLGLMIVFLGGMTFAVDWSGDEEELVVAAPAPATTTSTTSTTTTTSMPPTTTTTTTTMPPTTTTTTTTTTMPPTTTTIPLGVEKGYLCFRINKTFEMGTNFNGEWVPTNSEELAEDLRAQLDEAGIQDRYAGIVLTFGVSPASTQGIRNAELFSQFVLPALAPMFDAAATREFWDGRSRTGNWETSSGRVVTEKVDDSFRVDIYLLDDGQGSPALAADHKPDCG